MTALLAVIALIPGPAPNVATGVGHVPVDHRPVVVRPYRARLLRMAWCESTGRWHIYNPPYSGGLQFNLPTWRSVGGRGYPHWHSRLEQMYRAVLLIKRRGYQPWPVCGFR